MKKKRIIGILLAAAAAVGILTACQETDDGGDVSSDNRGTSTTIHGGDNSGSAHPTGIPDDVRFEGRTFRFLTSPRSGDAYTECWLDYEDGVTDTINTAVYKRNSATEDRLGIKLETEHSATYYGAVSTIIDLNTAEEFYYDAAYLSAQSAGVASLDGHFLDLNTLKYVDFTHDWWDGNCHEMLSVGRKNFLMVSDISMSVFERAHFTYFNKQMLKDLGVTEDPYQLVRSGEWTFDKMYEMIKLASWENGDGTRDEKDKYGLYNLNIPAVLNSFDYSFTGKDEDDYPVLFELTDSLHQSFDKLRELALDKNLQYDQATMLDPSVDVSKAGHIWAWTRSTMFPNDQILFMYAGFMTTEEIKEMKSDYGIVPNAKKDADQKRYQSAIDFYADMLCVPSQNSDPEYTGAVLEYMAYASTDTVKHEYIETVLKNKRNRDDDTKEMIDIISKSLHYEISDIYDLGIRNIIVNGAENNTLQSQYDKFKIIYQNNIESMKEKVSKIG